MERARTIDEVLDRLTLIIERSRRDGMVDGYFAALYRRVTEEVKSRIGRGEFDDGPRMERFDVVFANRYLDAWEQDGAGGEVSGSWSMAFGARERFWPVVLQHLLLGMNAHINLDLGVAAAEVAPGASIHKLEQDFNRINAILASLVNDVQDRLVRVWPPLRMLDRIGGDLDEAVVNFSMERARDQAWRMALALAGATGGDERLTCIRDADVVAAKISRRILRPGVKLSTILRFVRLCERGSVADKLAAVGG